ncbi:MAG: YdiU family protein [Rickettsiales bacterium]|nr:YdiU family protein [Rickettsiales bacterium]
MNQHTKHPKKWNFDNSYLTLSDDLYTKIVPTHVNTPEIVILNYQLADELGIPLEEYSDRELAQLFSGNVLPDGAEPIAQAYAGHQFGRFTILGDGRAHLLGEHVSPNNVRSDIQLKGSGQTPYSRRGDGRAALGPMLREYIISEAMYQLGIPTTRSLAVVTTGEPVYRESMLQGAVLTRTASSHIRVGTFEYLAAQQDVDGIRSLADYTIDRHFPDIKYADQPYRELLKAVMDRQISLIVDWLRVGFIHGVMNTDNVSICGETIDYGPCAFMDAYDPQTVFSSIDQMGRYAYANQPKIVQWNIARFAETLLPILDDDLEKAGVIGEHIIRSFNISFQKEWLNMMRCKLGLFGGDKHDERLVGDLLQWMQRQHIDYTNGFRALISETIPEGPDYQTREFKDWWERWQTRLKQNNKPLNWSLQLMRAKNPAIIPRNHRVEQALEAAEEASDFSKFLHLLNLLSEPYREKDEYNEFRDPPSPDERVYQTFCGT